MFFALLTKKKKVVLDNFKVLSGLKHSFEQLGKLIRPSKQPKLSLPVRVAGVMKQRGDFEYAGGCMVCCFPALYSLSSLCPPFWFTLWYLQGRNAGSFFCMKSQQKCCNFTVFGNYFTFFWIYFLLDPTNNAI